MEAKSYKMLYFILMTLGRRDYQSLLRRRNSPSGIVSHLVTPFSLSRAISNWCIIYFEIKTTSFLPSSKLSSALPWLRFHRISQVWSDMKPGRVTVRSVLCLLMESSYIHDISRTLSAGHSPAGVRVVVGVVRVTDCVMTWILVRGQVPTRLVYGIPPAEEIRTNTPPDSVRPSTGLLLGWNNSLLNHEIISFIFRK